MITLVSRADEFHATSLAIDALRCMGAIHLLFAKWGFVRIRDYGLSLTADNRVLSTRTAILDDGTGGRIVGWRDNDLAAAELEPWEPNAKKPARVVPIAPIARIQHVPAVPRARAETPDVVASPPEPDDEGDWDWEIAVARARAVAEEVEAATPPPVTVLRIVERQSDIPTRRVEIDPIEIDPPTRPVAIIPSPERRTIIPVPTLPRASATSPVRPLDQPRRFPRATDRHAAQDEDRTRPGIAVRRRA